MSTLARLRPLMLPLVLLTLLAPIGCGGNGNYRHQRTEVIRLQTGPAEIDAATGFGDIDVAATSTPLPTWATAKPRGRVDAAEHDDATGATPAANEVLVVVRLGSSDADRLAATTVDATLESGRVVIRPRFPEPRPRKTKEAAHVVVRADGFAGAELDSGFGDITVIDLSGSVRTRTGHGDIVVTDVQGDVRAEAGFGDVTITGGAGVLELESGHGDVRINRNDVSNSSANTINAASGFGDITVRTPATDINAGSGHGDIDITLLASSAPGTVSAGSGHGDVRVRGLTGPIRVGSGYGDINVTLTDSFTGPLQAKTDRGRIRGHGFPYTTERTEDDQLVMHADFGPGPESALGSGFGSITVTRK